MKALFTGSGSIGSRHITNLSAICKKRGIPLEIDVIRKSGRVLPSQVKELIHKEIYFEEDLSDHYDVLFVTDETKEHYKSMLKYKEQCDHMFIEKPIFESPEYDISCFTPSGKGVVYYVACPIRYSNYYTEIERAVKENEVLSARIIFSSYMPNWQKGRDYRKSFRCYVERGGGVDIDSLHEIDYMKALFGMPNEVLRVARKLSNLEMNACDIASYIFSYPNLMVEMHLDYFGRSNNRRIELFTEDDVIIIDFNKRTVEKQCKGEIYTYEQDDTFYIKEMEYFVNMITFPQKIENKNTIYEALQSLKLAKGIK